MRTRMAAGVIALLAGALILPNQELLARDCGDGSSGKASACSSKRAGIKGWSCVGPMVKLFASR